MRDDLTPDLRRLCDDDADAVDFIVRMWTLFVVWDDAVDRDKSLAESEINDAMLWAMFGMQEHPFFRKHEDALRPAIFQTVASWMVANKFQRSGDAHKLQQAYFLRCSPYELFATVVALAAGFRRQVEAIEFFRTVARGDTLESFMKEHGG